MNFKKHIRKGVSLVVVSALVIAAGVLSHEDVGYRVGRGSGTNEKIVRVEELSALLNDCFSEDQNREIATVALTEKQYTSVTMSEVSSVYMDSEIYQRVGEQAIDLYTKLTMQREMTVYFTDTEALYDSQATVSFKMRQNDEKNTADISFHIRVYIGPGGTMLNFEEFMVAQNGELFDPIDKVRGKWIGGASVPDPDVEEMLSSLTSVNEMNFRTLSTMGDFLEANDSDAFIRNGSQYTMTNESFENFVKELVAILGVSIDEFPIGMSGAFLADFSDNEMPRVSIKLGSNSKDSSEYGRYSIRMSEADDFVFSNINNTEIELSSGLEVISFAEFKDLVVA